MNKLIIGFLGIFIICSCNNPLQKTITKENTQTSQRFILNGQIKSYLSNKVYLNKIIENRFYPVDSAQIENNSFVFEGIVNYPERFALTFENYSSAIVLIIENTTFEIEIDPNLIQEPIISGSPLNLELNDYKLYSKRIFSKFELLFPKFQKARLENDVETLEEVGAAMKLIETEFRDFSYDFIQKNNHSFVAAMILRDQLKTSTIDTLRIKEAYNLLSENVKHSPDAQIIAFSLN